MNVRLKVGILLAVFVVATLVGGRMMLAADSASAEAAAKKVGEELMKKISDSDFVGMSDVIVAHEGLLSKPSAEARLAFVGLRTEFGKIGGKPLTEFELVRTDTIGKSFLRLTYLDKFDRHALMWQFVFYKVGEKWKLQGMSWNANPLILLGKNEEPAQAK